MARLIVAHDFSFNPETFAEGFEGLIGDTVKEQTDLWKVDFADGTAFVRGDDFTYDNGGTPGNSNGEIEDDTLLTGDVSSFSFNGVSQTIGETGPALIRIRGIEGLSGEQVHDTLMSETIQAVFGILRTVFHGDDVLNGANESDYLVGFDGADKIDGNGRGDSLYGGHGADRLDGGGGADFIDGGKGKDSLYGGGDASTGDGKSDRFVFDNGDSGKNADHADRVHDFVSGTDVIDLSQTGADPLEIHFSSDHGNTKIVVDAHDGADKMVILVVGNDHVSISDISLLQA